MKKTPVFLTAIALCANFFLSTRIQTLMAFLLILTIGIIHGANDIQIIQKTQTKKYSFFWMVSVYSLVVLSMGLVFYFLPKVALAVFLGVSAYHFGEQHLSSHKPVNIGLSYVLYSTYGATIIFSLLYFNSELSLQIIYQITSLKLSPELLLTSWLIGFVISMALMVLMKFDNKLTPWYVELFYLILLFVCFKASSLVWGFAIYFVFWHSVPSLLDQVKFLSGSITKKTILHYFKSSMIYWMLALVGLAVFVFYFKDQEQLFLTLFFTFLAAITFPHVLVMHQLFHDYETKEDPQK